MAHFARLRQQTIVVKRLMRPVSINMRLSRKTDSMLSVYTNLDEFKNAPFFPQLQLFIVYTTTRTLKTFFRPATTAPYAFHTSALFNLDSLTPTFSERSVFAVNTTIPNSAFEFPQALIDTDCEKTQFVFGAPKISLQISLE